jgi:hypothetical protein
MSKFWDKIDKCKHKNLNPDYIEGIYCHTPYCGGDEVHCDDCGVFISQCGCGSNNGMSGWSENRWQAQRRKKYDSKLY